MNEKRKIKKINKTQRKLNRRRTINRDILKISIFIAALFIAMSLYFVYFIEFSAPSAINNPSNKRSDEYKEKVIRGDIYAAGGNELLAHSYVDENGTEIREYPYGAMFAHVIGYDGHGGLGLESSYNYYMLASNINFLQRIKNEFTGTKSPGNAIYTTLDVGLQASMDEILSSAGNCAAIAMDPDTGEIRALVSKPAFDPNVIDAIWDDIAEDEESSILVNRVTQGLYAPGSTFKIFTLDAYFKEHPSDYASYEYDCNGEFKVDDMVLHCYDYTAHGNINLSQSLAYSCNCSFANIGLNLNMNKFKANNKKLLFDSNLPVDIPYNKSRFSLDGNSSDKEIAQTVIGQGNTLMTPMHLACIISAISNDGQLMRPHLVSKIESSEGVTIKTFTPEVSNVLFQKNEATVLKEYLRGVVEFGTATTLSYGNYTAYGKTGTAETVSNFNTDTEASDHSWFAGWAEQGDKKLVVCVLIEKAQDTWASAAEFSKQIFDIYFN